MSQGVECYSCLPKTAWPPTWRTQFESESNPEQIMKEEPVIEDTTDQSQGELAIKLERYKKNLKASRLRKKGASDESR